MKTYGSTTGTAHQIKNFYGAVDHKARLALKVYGPVLMPDAFDTLTIRSGGVGNITGTDPVTFTEHFISSDSSYWNRIVSGEIIPLRLEAVRSGSTFSRTKYLNLIYRYSGSSAENTAHLLSYTGSTDTSYKSGLDRYGFSYKSSFSNGTDVIDLTISEATKTKLIHKGFAPQNWGEITYYSGYTTRKSLTPRSSSGDKSLISAIDYDAFEAFLSSNDIDTTKDVEITFVLSSNRWHFTTTGGVDVSITSSNLASTTGITASLTMTGTYLTFFDKKVPDPTSTAVTKRLRDGTEFESLCNCGGPMGNNDYIIDGQNVAAGSAISFKFGHSAGAIGDWFLSFSDYLTSMDMTLNHVGSIGDYFLYTCPLFNSAIRFPNAVSVGDNFLRYCNTFNSSLSFSKLKYIGKFFLANCEAFNTSFSISGVVSIANSFLLRCYSFNKSFTIPSSVTSIGTVFMGYMRDMTSTVTCSAAAAVAESSNATFCAYNASSASYTTGIKLSGTYKSDWQAKFPDSSSSPYRNTDVA